MELGLTGKVAMVAAASKGIGLATAKLLAAEGCLVSICGRTEETLTDAALEVGDETRTYIADVSSADDLAWWVEQTTNDLGTPSILVTNTGGPPAGKVDAMTDEQWQSGFDSTLMNVIRLTRLVQPGMAAQGWGRIVHVTSLVAKEPNQMLPISSTLRAGLMGLVRVQATEYGPSGVTVNCVLPGHTLTDRQRHLADMKAAAQGISQDAALAQTAASVPLQRLADPSEIAAAIVFLCSEPAGYITGTNLLVDGGITKGLA